MQKGIYRLHIQFKDTLLCGIFIATKERIQDMYDWQIDFGEAFGKHSSVIEKMTTQNLTLVTDDPVAVELFELHSMETGHNVVRLWEEQNS